MLSLELRLQEATAILETLRDQRVLVQADLWHWEQEQQTVLAEALRRDQDELQHWLSQETHYTSVLQQWMIQCSQEAQAALDRRKRWGYRIFILVACLFSAGFLLVMEIREIQTLRFRRDNPHIGEEQRMWSRMIQDAQRNINSLRSLQEPRLTPMLRACNKEVLSQRRRLEVLDNQIQIQETRVRVLQEQLALYP